MKILLVISAVFLSTACFGQTQPQFEKYDRIKLVQPSVALEENTPLRVVYLDKTKEKDSPAIFVNGTFVSSLSLNRLMFSPEHIENLTVEKGSTEIDNVKYPAKILIETKADYKPNFISLNAFKEKHVSTRDKSIVFQVDDEIIQGDYDKYIIDENYILRAIVEKVQIQNRRMDFTLIKLLTRSVKNVRDSKAIRLRGREGVAVVE